mmetsp:Transcript_2320/g.6943  ORF Transcript_2320/g.6943 Transcript_2320/m.6943 type:complete len:568 (-) Transcript_2320:116-1819(-)
MVAGEEVGERFELGGEREKLGESKARELLKQLTGESGKRFSRVSLSGKSFDGDAANVAKEALSKLLARSDGPKLTEIDLSDIVAGQPEDVARTVLKRLCSALEDAKDLEEINLSNNALGSSGIAACEPLLRNKPNLKRLYINNSGLNDDAAKMLRKFLGNNTKLEVLHINNNLLESSGSMQLCKMLTEDLQELVCSSVRLGRVGSMAIGQKMRSFNNVKYLDMSDNVVSDDGSEALANALVNQKNLRVLNLRDASLEDSGTISIMNALEKSAPDIEVIDLSANDISEEGAKAIAAAVKSKKKLRALLLEENLLSAKGSLLVAQALSAEDHPRLETVDFTANEIGGVPAVAICNMCMDLPSLTKIELNANKVPPSIVEKLKLKCGSKLGEMDENEGEEVELEENVEELISELTVSEKQENGDDTAEKSESVTDIIPDKIISAARNLRTEMETARQKFTPKFLSRPPSRDSMSTTSSTSSKKPSSSRRLSTTSLRKSRNSRNSNPDSLRANAASSDIVAEPGSDAGEKLSTDRSYTVAAISNVLIFLFFVSLVLSLRINSDDIFYVRPV